MPEVFDVSHIPVIAKSVLPERQYDVWRMTWIDNLSAEVIGQRLGVCERTVKYDRAAANKAMDVACKNIKFGRVRLGVTIMEGGKASFKPDTTAMEADRALAQKRREKQKIAGVETFLR